MKRSLSRAAATCALVVSAGGLASAAGAERLSTIADATSLNITVYNGGIALVHDRRRIDFGTGAQRIAWRDVAAQLQPETALLSEPAHPRDLGIVEQNFDYDVLGAASILAKYVGHDVTITHEHAVPGHPQRETARLLANNEGGPVLKYADRIETGIDGTISYPALPADLRDRPTLVLDVDAKHAGEHDLDLAYLTGGIGWHATYVGVVTPDGNRLDLDGFVTLSNESGATYRNARLQLVAGDVDTAQQREPRGAMSARMPVPSPPQMSEQNYFEYHLYTLARPTTIEQNQTKQVTLLSARAVPIKETLELRGSSEYYESESPDLGQRLSVGAYVTFANRGGDLGIPLPAGAVRLYKNDAGGTSQFLGADTIDHTPANEDVRLHVGDSFDVTARKKQTQFHAAFPEYDSSYEIVVGNAKKQAADVLVVEPIPCDWTISDTSAPFVKSSSSTATWSLRVPAGGKTALTYTTKIHCL